MTAQSATHAQPWRVCLFGKLQISDNLDGEPVSTLTLGTRRVGSLLAYLVLHPGLAHGREFLAETLWPNSDPRTARANFRVVLSNLRSQLKSLTPPADALLHIDPPFVEIIEDGFASDVAEFTQALQYAQAATDPDNRIGYLAQAVALYRGDLLLGYYDEWVAEAREQYKEQYRVALTQLADEWKEMGELERALRYALQAVTLDELREESHAEVIGLYLALGKRSVALRHYRKLERTLQRTMKRGPSAPLRKLLPLMRGAINAPDAMRATDAEEWEATETAPPPSVTSLPPDDAPPGASLPTYLTRFFDRPELTRIVSLLRTRRSRLLTLTGLPGAGKTRLAVEAARLVATDFPGAVWFLDGAKQANGAQLLEAALAMLPASAQLPAGDGGKSLLLVLDGTEQIHDAGATVTDLLQRVPNLMCLVISRVQLRVPGERVLPILPFPLPGEGASVVTLKADAYVRLLIDRIQMVRPDFALTLENAGEVGALCRSLGGLPLAAEMIAPWSQMLSLRQIIARMGNPFDLLTTTEGKDSGPHRSFYNEIKQTYSLLPGDLARFFALLMVFEGPFTLEAASTVLQEPQAGQKLLRLQEYSLLTVTQTGEGPAFHFLAMVRAFGQTLLSGEDRTQLRGHHAEYFLRLGKAAEKGLASAEREPWLAEIEVNVANFRLALDYWCDVDPACYLELAATLWQFWYVRNHIREGQSRLMQALGDATTPENPARARVLLGLASFAYAQGDSEAGRTLLETGLIPLRLQADGVATAAYLSHLAEWTRFRGDYDLSGLLLDEALALWHKVTGISELSPGAGETEALMPQSALGIIATSEYEVVRRTAETFRRAADLAYCRGQLALSATQYRKGQILFERIKDRSGIACCLSGLGRVACAQGQYEAARLSLADALRLYGRTDDERGAAWVQKVLGDIACRQGRLGDAELLTSECLETFRRLGSHLSDTVGTLRVVGVIALARNNPVEAQATLHQAREIGQQGADGRRVAYTRCFLAFALAATENSEAAAHWLQGLRWFCDTGDKYGLALSFEVGAAALAPRRNEAKKAALLWGAALALRQSIGAALPPTYQHLYEPGLQAVREVLGAKVFADGVAAGEQTPFEDAIAWASLLVL